MATSSIYQSVVIKNKNKCKKFIKALEEAQARPMVNVEFKRTVKQLTAEEIKNLFEDIDEQ